MKKSIIFGAATAAGVITAGAFEKYTESLTFDIAGKHPFLSAFKGTEAIATEAARTLCLGTSWYAQGTSSEHTCNSPSLFGVGQSFKNGWNGIKQPDILGYIDQETGEQRFAVIDNDGPKGTDLA